MAQQYTDETVSKIHRLAGDGISQREIARATGITKGQVQHVLEYLKPIPPEFKVIQLPKPLEIIGDAMIVGDVHVPATLWEFSHRVQRIAERVGISTIICAGDLMNADQMGKYPAIVSQPSIEDELAAARVLLNDWLMTFDHVYLLMGNHERRIQMANAGAFEAGDIFGSIITSSKVHTSDLGYCYLTSGGRPWYVAHGREYSVNPLTVGNKLAQKFQMNIISHHQHHVGVTRDEFDRYDVVDNGCLADDDKFAYVYMDTNKKPRMKKAFTMIRRGYPTQFVLNGITDWGEWGFDN